MLLCVCAHFHVCKWTKRGFGYDRKHSLTRRKWLTYSCICADIILEYVYIYTHTQCMDPHFSEPLFFSSNALFLNHSALSRVSLQFDVYGKSIGLQTEEALLSTALNCIGGSLIKANLLQWQSRHFGMSALPAAPWFREHVLAVVIFTQWIYHFCSEARHVTCYHSYCHILMKTHLYSILYFLKPVF